MVSGWKRMSNECWTNVKRMLDECQTNVGRMSNECTTNLGRYGHSMVTGWSRWGNKNERLTVLKIQISIPHWYRMTFLQRLGKL